MLASEDLMHCPASHECSYTSKNCICRRAWLKLREYNDNDDGKDLVLTRPGLMTRPGAGIRGNPRETAGNSGTTLIFPPICLGNRKQSRTPYPGIRGNPRESAGIRGTTLIFPPICLGNRKQSRTPYPGIRGNPRDNTGFAGIGIPAGSLKGPRGLWDV